MATLFCTDPRCRHEYRVPNEKLGSTLCCPNCGQLHTAKLSAEVLRSSALEREKLEAFAQGERPDVIPLELALVSLRSLWNVGTIFRTAEGLGLAHIHLLGFSPTPENPRMKKTALGAERVVPWSFCRDPIEGLEALRSRCRLVAMERCERSVPLDELVLEVPTCLVFGNEVVGLQEPVLECCHAVAEIPMYGAKQSLNVAVAASIAAHVVGRRLRQGQACIE